MGMTRVNTLNEIAELYVGSSQIIEENETVGKSKVNDELEEEKNASKSPTKDSGPEAAENYESKVVEAGATGKKDEKNHFSTGSHEKTNNENINTFTMDKKKSIFDKLYEDVLGGDDDLEMGMPFGDDDDDTEDYDGEDSGDEITLSLPKDLAEKLYDALGSMLDSDDIEDIEDIEDGEDDSESDDMFQEAPEAQQLGDAGPSGADMDKGGLKGKNNKVSGSGSIHSSNSGHGDGKIKGGSGEPSELGDKSGTLTGKNNKVPGKIKGHGQDTFA